MKNYHKLWKFLHSRYMNQLYSRKGRDGNFGSIAERQGKISLPEVTMMLKDHGAYPRLINKDELAQLVRLVIMKTDGAHASDLTMLSFP